MELRQRTELRRLLIPELKQSMAVLTLPVLELRSLIQEELLTNPTIEEVPLEELGGIISASRTGPVADGSFAQDEDEPGFDVAAPSSSLYDILLTQLSIFTENDADFSIGLELLSCIDENGYFSGTLEAVAQKCDCTLADARRILTLVQGFDPPGVGATTTAECLLLQLEHQKEDSPHLVTLIRQHLDDIAKKNYTRITKSLGITQEELDPLLKKVLRLDPKPGRKYSNTATQHVVPDVRIDEKGDEFCITIDRETLPELRISATYRRLLKNASTDEATKAFIREKIRSGLELLRAVSRRKQTLRQVVEAIAQEQREAVLEGPAHLKPMTFKDIAAKIGVHETTVCRAVNSKYVDTPWGIVALKDFFPSSVKNGNGEAHSSSRVKMLIKELIDGEEKTKPLSDQEIVEKLKSSGIEVSRRTVTKYREESNLPSSIYRKQR